MDPAQLGALTLLALVDSTSFGTLVIPIWMMLAPRLRISRLLIYLGTVTAFYFATGLLLLAGIDALTGTISRLGDLRALRWVELVIGVALFIASFWIDRRRNRTAAQPPATRGLAWRERLVGEQATVGSVMAIGVAATLVELASMLPYLGAIGLLSASGASAPLRIAVLAGYVLLMALPALTVLLLRRVARRAIEPLLQRLDQWLTARSGSILGWTLGIVGFLLAGHAYAALA